MFGVRKILCVIVMCCSSLFCRAISSTYVNRLHHFFRVSVDGGYQRDIPQRGNGVSFGGGIGYRRQQGNFLLDVGLNAHYVYSMGHLSSLTDSLLDYDVDNMPFTGLRIYSDRRIDERRLSFQIPILVGVEMKKIQFIVGPKFNIGFRGESSEKGMSSYMAKYDVHPDPFTDMPGYGFRSGEPYTTPKTKLPFNYDIRAHLETIFFLGQKEFNDSPISTFRCYFSIYGEYSFFHSSVYTPAEVGLRLSLLFEVPVKDPCNCSKW